MDSIIPIALAFLMATGALAGCAQPEAAPRLEAFHATIQFQGTQRGSVGEVMNLNFDGPHPFVASDGEIRQGYRLTFATTNLPNHSGSSYQVLDAAMRPVRLTYTCSVQSHAGCEKASSNWVPTHAFFGVGLASQNDQRIVAPDTFETGDVTYVFDGAMVPVRALHADGREVWHRISYESGAALNEAEVWPTGPLPTMGAPTNPLFPDADQDLSGFGFTPLEALAALRLRDPLTAQALDRGACVVQTEIRADHYASRLATNLAEVTFLIQDGTKLGYHSLRWEEDLLGRRGFGLLASESTRAPQPQVIRTCQELSNAPWPDMPLAKLFQQATKWSGTSTQSVPVDLLLIIGDDGTGQGAPWIQDPSPLRWQILARGNFLVFDPQHGGYQFAMTSPLRDIDA